MFAIAFGYLEASVVVYLRNLYYPDGFSFPLVIIPSHPLVVELFRELSTLVMLASVAFLVGRRFWECFGYFIILFGIWDIFFYLWLKATINWPPSLFTWDILFLLPIPWIGPVIAPVLVSVLMIGCGTMLTYKYATKADYRFQPPLLAWLLSLAGIAVILYSFMYDTAATFRQQLPQPYPYALLVIGLLLLLGAFAVSYRRSNNEKN